MPEGSVMYNFGSLWSKPTISVEIPKGRTPPLWVYFFKRELAYYMHLFSGYHTCWIWAIWRVMYSTDAGSSTVNRWLWHSILALLINTRASAVKPLLKSIHYFIKFYSFPTCKCHTDVIVKHANFTNSSSIL